MNNTTNYYGVKVSDYGIENGYVDYRTLAKVVGNMVLNNYVINYEIENWEIEKGTIEEEEQEEEEEPEIFQYYIITPYGAKFLKDHTSEIVYYNDELNIYLWGITHFGTSWDYVLTDIKLKK